MKKISVALALFCSACAPQKVQVRVENTLPWDRKEEVLAVEMQKIEKKLKTKEIQVQDAEGQAVPFQLSYTGQLLIQAGTGAKEKKTFTIRKGKAPSFPSKTYARFITERKDDFAWENDRVAFRLYGPALVATDGPSNGLDIWYKRTPNLVIDSWYKADLAGQRSYHEDHGEGLDDYKVGPTLGAGAMAPHFEGKLLLNQNFEHQELLENGPLRTSFRLVYKELIVKGEPVSEERIISLDAGSQLSKITQVYGNTKAMQVAAGFVKRSGASAVEQGPGYVLYEEPATAKASGVFLGLVRPDGWLTVKENEQGHVLALADYLPARSLTYYAGFGWEKYGFKERSAFKEYVEKEVQNMKTPLIIRIK